MDLMWFPMVVHSEPLMTPMFLTDRIVKNKSLSASAEERDQQGVTDSGGSSMFTFPRRASKDGS